MKKNYRVLTILEDSILVTLVVVMILMAVGQIVLRNFFDYGLVWADSFVRILVLWIGLVGAMVASREGRHINIDVISRFLPARVKAFSSAVVELATAVICGLLVYYSLTFVKMELDYGELAFAGVPAWICQAIIPVGFLIIGVRYLISSFTNFSKLRSLKS